MVESDLDLPVMDPGPELDNARRMLIMARLVRKYTQAELAKLAGIHVNTLNRYEAGRGKITLEVFIRLMYALDLDWSTFNTRLRDI